MKFFFSLFFGILSCHSLSAGELKVLGEGEVFVKATLAEIRFSVDVKEETKVMAEKGLSEAQNVLQAELKGAGVEKLNTANYVVYPEYSSDKPAKVVAFIGRSDVTVEITVKDAGEIISKVTHLSGVRVDGVQLKASPKDLKEAKKQALQIAIQHAKASGEVALETLQLKQKGIKEVIVSPKNTFVAPYAKAAAFNANGAEFLGEEKVTEEVQLVLEF